MMYNYRRANLGKNDFRCSFNLSFSNYSLSHTLSLSHASSPYSRNLQQEFTAQPQTTYLIPTPIYSLLRQLVFFERFFLYCIITHFTRIVIFISYTYNVLYDVGSSAGQSTIKHDLRKSRRVKV